MPGKRVLIYGGSFDPPHHGHMALLRAGIAHAAPDYAVVMPTFLSAFKDDHHAGYTSRLAMAKAAVLDEEWSVPIEISDFEGSMRRRVFTHEVMEYIHRGSPKEVFFLCGGDVLSRLEEWKDPAALAAAGKFVIGMGSGSSVTIPEFKHPFAIELIKNLIPGTMDGGRVSSTAIRKRMQDGRGIEPFVSRGVLRYIYTSYVYPPATYKK
jgi:nicotinate-nucleotide adenylyltransferase